ncbi:DNA replication and repair protein RecO [[Leptolyngbya] sp. PCC 7376]|uniref:DNA repair protein RecO n=1 Tax=[Leptolyngbya] sp. PCC 7376 TaxID=111781 RepID=UPI00029EEE00|nr:DNA repair protein RecO [[Leptolyngbya] sp. PCC 7376]AFY40147.1 DNA replication and repair protein RecO [[Leptolyngbya] sp. PCC 7376]
MATPFKVTGIVIKGFPFGESDRLVTILSPELGLLKAVVPSARKHRSQLRGRTELLVVNDFLLVKGRSLNRVSQAETLTSHAGLSKDFAKLAAGQYLAELVGYLGASDLYQAELYNLLLEHLQRLEKLEVTTENRVTEIVAHLTQAIFHLLAIAGLAPQTQRCNVTQDVVEANFTDPRWRTGFSHNLGGILKLDQRPTSVKLDQRLTALELDLLQCLAAATLPDFASWSERKTVFPLETAWLRLERLLRDYSEYHIGKSLKTAILIDTLAPLSF